MDWYRCRWLIEQLFRTLKKQGLKIEDSQIDDAGTLIKLVAIARLGGWDGYPSLRPPGPITFKNGIDTLKTLAEGWALRDLCMP